MTPEESFAAQEARDAMAAGLPTTPCPPWCGEPAGHPWGAADLSQVSRLHLRRFGDCEVAAVELMGLGTDAIELVDLSVGCDRWGLDGLDADDAEGLARDLLAAVACLRSLPR